MKNWEKRYSSADDNNHEIPLSFNFDPNQSTKVPHNDGKNKTKSCLNCGKDTGDPIVNICSENCRDEFING